MQRHKTSGPKRTNKQEIDLENKEVKLEKKQKLRKKITEMNA